MLWDYNDSCGGYWGSCCVGGICLFFSNNFYNLHHCVGRCLNITYFHFWTKRICHLCFVQWTLYSHAGKHPKWNFIYKPGSTTLCLYSLCFLYGCRQFYILILLLEMFAWRKRELILQGDDWLNSSYTALTNDDITTIYWWIL